MKVRRGCASRCFFQYIAEALQWAHATRSSIHYHLARLLCARCVEGGLSEAWFERCKVVASSQRLLDTNRCQLQLLEGASNVWRACRNSSGALESWTPFAHISNAPCQRSCRRSAATWISHRLRKRPLNQGSKQQGGTARKWSPIENRFSRDNMSSTKQANFQG